MKPYLVSAAVGLLVVRWGVRALVALAPIEIPRIQQVSPDSRVVARVLATDEERMIYRHAVRVLGLGGQAQVSG